jgi:AcrR family transcriptional regulator
MGTSNKTSAAERPEGLRDRKRRETHQRIADAGLKLFIQNGYDATTLDAIAAAASISRRTFFYYFKSKEDVLMAMQGDGFPQALRPTIQEESPSTPPLQAVRNCVLKLIERYETVESIIIDRLLRSSEALRVRKLALYVEMEQSLFAGMCELWPSSKQTEGLRIVAMAAMGVLRLAMDRWRQDNAKHSLAYYVRQGFDLLEDQTRRAKE